MKLDTVFLEAVAPSIQRTWAYVEADAMQLGGRMTNSGAMELVLDAGRLGTCGGPQGKAADALVSQAIDEHGYPKVSRFLCSKIKLY